MIEGKTGFLVDERDIRAMAEGIVKLANEPGLAAALGLKGREHVCNNFSRKQSLGTLCDIIQRAAESKALIP